VAVLVYLSKITDFLPKGQKQNLWHADSIFGDLFVSLRRECPALALKESFPCNGTY
jgi:hypothetical protein